MTGGKSLKVDKFTGRNNFSLWKIKIRALLNQQGLWTPLLKPAPNPLPADFATQGEKAYYTFLLGLWMIISSLRLLKGIPLPVCGVI